jgi:glucokinase
MSEATLLAGDIGGTKSYLGIFREGELLRSARLASPDYPSLEALLGAFLGSGEAVSISAACFGIPGPVHGNRAHAPNLPWPEIDGDALAAGLGIPRVCLINDVAATAEGIPVLPPGDFLTLQEGEAAAAGNRVLIAAGTGLGMCFLPWIDGAWRPVASEGGHSDFAPQDDTQIQLLRSLRTELGHVSVERLVSGPGLAAIYRHFQEEVGLALDPDADPAQISAAALAGTDSLAVRALKVWLSLYGAAAGNLALLGTATGGVYIGGGIAPKILPQLHGPFLRSFLGSFLGKGRFSDYLRAIPVRVILNDKAALLGAGQIANQTAIREV